MIKIICSGKIKEKYLNDAIEEYKKRLSKYTKLEIIEIKDENSEKALKIEAENIKKNIKEYEKFTKKHFHFLIILCSIIISPGYCTYFYDSSVNCTSFSADFACILYCSIEAVLGYCF